MGAILAPLCALGLASCQDVPTSSAGDPPLFEIKDAAHNGNPRVFFLPPMVSDPSDAFTDGSFVGDLEVVIKVCIWNTTLDACSSPVLETYDRNSGPGSETVRVPDGADYYLVNWHTDNILSQYPLGESEAYRIVVEVGKIIAFADVEVVETGQELKELRNAKSGEVIPLLDGRTLPIKVRIEEGWETYGAVLDALEGGEYHTCALTPAGKAYCWGRGDYGQLGDGGTQTSNVPVAVQQGTLEFSSLAAGYYHTCGLTTAGKAYCWGWGYYGALGYGGTQNSKVPIAVQQGTLEFSSLTANHYHTCGLAADGKAYCWGTNTFCVLGNSSPAPSFVPVAVQQGTLEFSSLTAGTYHTCALTAAGAAYCWGWGHYSALGNDAPYNLVPAAVQQGALEFSSLTAGQRHTCGLTAAGKAYCWGWGDLGALGNGGTATNPFPVAVQQGTLEFTSLTAADHHTCGITTGETAYCWGWNHYGQLGDGSTATSPVPVPVLEPEGGW